MIGAADPGDALIRNPRATLREATPAEKNPAAGFTTWCGISNCRVLAEFVGARGADRCFYCPKHAEAFARMNGLAPPRRTVQEVQS